MLDSQPIFDYESDWVEYFNSILTNEIRDDIDNKNYIKANIIETNQSLDAFLKRNPNIERIPSMEKSFHNLKYKDSSDVYYFYLNNQNERFWIIHNVEKQEKIQKIFEDLTSNDYLQDTIYLSNYALQDYQTQFGSYPLGFTLNFEQLFSDDDENPVFNKELSNFEDVDFTLQLWPKHQKSIDFFIDQFKNINCPINYKSLNFVFEDDAHDVLVKEDLHYNGAITIKRGKELLKHLKFIDGIRDDYSRRMEEVEERRFDWTDMKGEVFSFILGKEINPINFVNALNSKAFKNFKINAYFMYHESDYFMFTCIDIHTGGKFYMQVFPDKINITLEKDSCGNIIFRFFTNLQRYFSITSQLLVDGSKFNV